MPDHKTVAAQVHAFIAAKKDEGAAELMAALNEFDQTDMFPRAVIRLLLMKQTWPFKIGGSDATLEKFFGPDAEPKLSSEDYLTRTNDVLKTWFADLEPKKKV